MKKFDKRKNRGIEYVNEEDVAKALLNKKTEMALYKDLEPVKEDKKEELTYTQKMQVQEEMMSALDVLRKERGQKTIEQEELEYSLLQQQEQKEDDFTTYTLNQGDLSTKFVQQALEKDEPVSISEKEVKEEKTEDKPKKEKKKKEKKKKEKKNKKQMSPLKKTILILVLLGFALMGGYAYKIYVYDPNNIVSQDQQDAYDRLIAYADEYSMLSDSEKLELLDMTDDYDCLLSKQKKQINEYFKDSDHVGKTYTALIKELQNYQNNLQDETSEEYQTLKTFIEGWETYSEEQKRTIINYKDLYSSLNSTLKQKIDDLARTYCTKSFSALYTEYHDTIVAENKEQIDADNEELEQLEAQLKTEQATLDDYQTYAESLQSQLESLQSSGSDTTELQSQIETNNEMITQQQATVDELNTQINQLKEEITQLSSV